jgi:hypothetical protein
MADAAKIAERALNVAAAFLKDARREIVDLADGDLEALFQASQIVRDTASGGRASEHSGEHLAFSLITAAYQELRPDETTAT